MSQPEPTSPAVSPATSRFSELLGHVIEPTDIEKTKDDLGNHATGEILMIATLCRVLAQTTHEHAQELASDGNPLKSEEATQRAETYLNTYWAICHEWPVS